MSMEMESLLEEQKKVEKELETMNAKEGVDFIDENHAAYDKVVEALKKLESDHCVTHEERRRRRTWRSTRDGRRRC